MFICLRLIRCGFHCRWILKWSLGLSWVNTYLLEDGGQGAALAEATPAGDRGVHAN